MFAIQYNTKAFQDRHYLVLTRNITTAKFVDTKRANARISG